MGLYQATLKNSRHTNGVKLEKGMSVEVATSSSPHAKDLVEPFKRKYGVDIIKGGASDSIYFDIKKIG